MSEAATLQRAPTTTDSGQRPRWRRHPADVARLVTSALIVALLALTEAVAPAGVRNVSADLVALVDNLPSGLASALVGLVQVVAFVAPFVVIAIAVVRRRFDVLGVVALAALVAAVMMALLNGSLGDAVPIESIREMDKASWFTGARFPSATYLAAAVAMLVAAGPWVPRKWRRAAWVFITLVTLARVLTATMVPLNLLMLLALGAAAGSATLVIFGAPPRRVDPDTLRDALAASGLPTSAIAPVGDRPRTPAFRAQLTTGEDAFVKVIGRDERDTDIFFRTTRALRVKGLGDDRPSASRSRAVEHEALALSVAAGAGVRVPAPLGVGRTDQDAGVLAVTWQRGTTLAALSDDDLTDELLDDLWQQVARLQRRRVAHRALRPSNVLVEAGQAWVVDFRRADLAASDEALGADLAELLTTLSLRIGPERAVARAARALPAADLARALPLVQPAVLSGSTRKALRDHHDHKALIDDVRHRLASAAGVDDIELAKVHRVSLKGIVTLVGSVVLATYLFSIVANWSEIWTSIKDVNTAYLPWMVAMMIGTYLAGAMSMLGSVVVDLPFLRTTAVMFAQAFLNRFTPANAGGMALRARYLQLNGVDIAVAATAVGLTSAASGVMQAVFVVVFLVWGGSTGSLGDMKVPNVSAILWIVVLVGAVGGIIVLSGWGRRVVIPKVKQVAGKVMGELRALARDPGKAALLFGGAALSKLATIIAFWLSVRAFGVDMTFSKAGALYMVANTVGSAVPTPGGVGGIEAALTAVLLSFGVENSTAAAIVLLFRLITFWLPTIPGWGFLQYVEKKGIV